MKTEKQDTIQRLIKSTCNLQSVFSREIKVIIPAANQPNIVPIQPTIVNPFEVQLYLLFSIILILQMIILIRIRDKR